MKIQSITSGKKVFQSKKFVFLYAIHILALMWLSACSTSSPSSIVTDEKGLKLPDYQENLDVSKALLNPDDVKDIFSNTSFSISQDLKNSVRVGYNAKYPTEQVEHTSEFSMGFFSQIEIYKAEKDSINSFLNLIEAQKSRKSEELKIKNLADKTVAYKDGILTSEGAELKGTEYNVFIQGKSTLVTITLRTDKNVSTAELEKLGQLVLSRLSK